MLAASRVKMSDSERKKKSEQEHVRHFLHKTCNEEEVSGSFTLQSCKTTAKKCTKKVCCCAKLLFFLLDLLLVFFFTALVAFVA